MDIEKIAIENPKKIITNKIDLKTVAQIIKISKK